MVIIRGKFSTSWARQADGANYCVRNGEPTVCSTNFPVTDYLGKPVLMLSDFTVAAGTAGLARYQAFGAANRREARYANNHYCDHCNDTVMTIADDVPPGFDGWARVLLNYVDDPASITLKGQAQPFADIQAHVWSNWVYGASPTTWPLVYRGAGGYGFDMEAYEVKLKQSGVHGFWTPLRLPGQYYDEETELHENWNRYYDPSVGRYLQHEPMLSQPNGLVSTYRRPRLTVTPFGTLGSLLPVELSGSPLSGTPRRRTDPMTLGLPVYSYANSNPLFYVDPNGMTPYCDRNPGSCEREAEILNEERCRCEALGGKFDLAFADASPQDPIGEDIHGGICDIFTPSCGPGTPATGWSSSHPTDLDTWLNKARACR